MSEPAGGGQAHRRRAALPTTVDDLRFAAGLGVALVLFGALLGLFWAAWTPTGPAAQIFPGGGFLTDETNEGVIAMDGRYLVLVAPAGILTAVAVWFLRRFRGPLVALGLIVGGLLGSLALKVVGGWVGGGSYAGRTFLSGGQRVEVTSHLPLDVHATGLLFVWPALAALVYGMLTAFAVRDDLGRPDPVRDALVPPAPEPFAPADAGAWAPGPSGAGRYDPSVDAGRQAYGGGGHGDAPGPLQQRDLPPQ